jgi:hypothetical protein
MHTISKDIFKVIYYFTEAEYLPILGQVCKQWHDIYTEVWAVASCTNMLKAGFYHSFESVYINPAHVLLHECVNMHKGMVATLAARQPYIISTYHYVVLYRMYAENMYNEQAATAIRYMADKLRAIELASATKQSFHIKYLDVDDIHTVLYKPLSTVHINVLFPGDISWEYIVTALKWQPSDIIAAMLSKCNDKLTIYTRILDQHPQHDHLCPQHARAQISKIGQLIPEGAYNHTTDTVFIYDLCGSWAKYVNRKLTCVVDQLSITNAMTLQVVHLRDHRPSEAS